MASTMSVKAAASTTATSTATSSGRGNSPVNNNELEALFSAVKQGQSETVRQLITNDRSLCREKRTGDYRFPVDVELDGYNLLGAYINSMTALHYSILLGYDEIAADLIDGSFQEDLEITFGLGNTALHLATLVGSHRLVKLLLDRGCNRLVKNRKGISPLDVVDDPELRAIFDQ